MEIKIQPNKYTKTEKPQHVKQLIYDTLDLLQAVGLPLYDTDRGNERMATAFLAVARVQRSLGEACSIYEAAPLRTRDIIEYENRIFLQDISPGSYDDVRRKDLKFLTEAGVVLNTGEMNASATNSPNRKYGLAPEFAQLTKTYGTEQWQAALETYRDTALQLRKALERKRELDMFPVHLPSGMEIKLHNDAHNRLQATIIRDFLPRFGFGADVLYVGDAADKDLWVDKEQLARLRFFTLEHDKLPDIVAYSPEKNLLYLIECLHSTGPMDELRVKHLKELLRDCPAQLLFFTAFESKKAFRSWAAKIAWESEVWIAESPDHLIHFNGYKFLELHQ